MSGRTDLARASFVAMATVLHSQLLLNHKQTEVEAHLSALLPELRDRKKANWQTADAQLLLNCHFSFLLEF